MTSSFKLHPSFTRGIVFTGCGDRTRDYLNLRGKSFGTVAMALAVKLKETKMFTSETEEKMQLESKDLEIILHSVSTVDVFDRGIDGINKNHYMLKKLIHPDQLEKAKSHIHMKAEVELVPIQNVSKVTKVKTEAVKNKIPLIVSGNLENGSNGMAILDPWASKPIKVPFLIKGSELYSHNAQIKLEHLSGIQGISFTEADAIKRGVPWFNAKADGKGEYPDWTIGEFNELRPYKRNRTAVLFNGFVYGYSDRSNLFTKMLNKIVNKLNRH